MEYPGPDSPAEPRRRAGVGSGGVALGAVVAMVLLWWVTSGNAFQGPEGSDDRYAVPDVEVPAPGTRSTTSGPEMSNQNGLRIEGYAPEEAGTRLVLSYVAGAEECTGSIDTPEVLETDGAVTVTLSLVPPEKPAVPCPGRAEPGTVRVDLDTPLGDRSLLDGSFSPRVRVEQDTADE